MNRTINFIFRVVARREESFFVQDALVPNANQAKCFILSLRKGFWIKGGNFLLKTTLMVKTRTEPVWDHLLNYLSGVIEWLLEIEVLITQVAANWPIKISSGYAITLKVS